MSAKQFPLSGDSVFKIECANVPGSLTLEAFNIAIDLIMNRQETPITSWSATDPPIVIPVWLVEEVEAAGGVERFMIQTYLPGSGA